MVKEILRSQDPELLRLRVKNRVPQATVGPVGPKLYIAQYIAARSQARKPTSQHKSRAFFHQLKGQPGTGEKIEQAAQPLSGR